MGRKQALLYRVEHLLIKVKKKKKKGIEVLLLSDPVDNLISPELHEFDGKQLQSVSKGEIDLSNLEDEQEKEEQQKPTTSSCDQDQERGE